MEKAKKTKELSRRLPKKRKAKAQRKDSNYDDQEERKQFERERQKGYSRANRLRKKEYYKKLEEKVHFLQSEVERLNIELLKEKSIKKSFDCDCNPIQNEIIDTEMIMGEKIKSTEAKSLKDIYLEEIKKMAAKIIPKREERLAKLQDHLDSALKSLF